MNHNRRCQRRYLLKMIKIWYFGESYSVITNCSKIVIMFRICSIFLDSAQASTQVNPLKTWKFIPAKEKKH